jgi:hypothetical protein
MFLAPDSQSWQKIIDANSDNLCIACHHVRDPHNSDALYKPSPEIPARVLALQSILLGYLLIDISPFEQSIRIVIGESLSNFVLCVGK